MPETGSYIICYGKEPHTEVEVNDMKTMLANEILSKIWGGVEVPPEPEKPDFPFIYITLGHGKTEPGHNEEIFNKEKQF